MVLSVFFRTEDPACLLFFHFGNFLEAGWSSTTKLTLASALLEGTDVRFANGHGRCTSACPLCSNSGHDRCPILRRELHRAVRCYPRFHRVSMLNNSLGDGAGAGKNQPQSDMGKFPIFSIIISDLLQSSHSLPNCDSWEDGPLEKALSVCFYWRSREESNLRPSV